jgi:trigger factor
MKIIKNILSEAQIELTVEVETLDLDKFLTKAAVKLSEQVKVAGFRPGKAPYDVVKGQVGEAVIWEEAAKLFINKNLDKIVADNCPRPSLGMPQISITKLAPGNNLEFKVTVSMIPEVKLGEYKNLGVKKEAVDVSEAEIDKVLAEFCEAQAKEAMVARGAAQGDKVTVDIKMFMDKVPLEGGQSQGTAVIIGKDYLIPGFDEKLLGAKAGDLRDFELVYPADHFQKNIAGKRVEFSVTIKDVYERTLPQANDELAKNFGLKNLEDLRHNIEHSISHEKEHKAEEKAHLAMINALLEKTVFGEIAEVLVDSELDNMMAELAHNVEHHGGKVADYLTSIKKTADDLKTEWRGEALKRVKSALLLRAVAEAEKIEPKAEDIEHELGHLRDHYKDDTRALEIINSDAYARRLASELANRQTILKLGEWNIK